MASTRPPTRDADLEASSDDDGEERRGAADASAPGAAADAGDLQREWAARRARFWNVSFFFFFCFGCRKGMCGHALPDRACSTDAEKAPHARGQKKRG